MYNGRMHEQPASWGILQRHYLQLFRETGLNNHGDKTAGCNLISYPGILWYTVLISRWNRHTNWYTLDPQSCSPHLQTQSLILFFLLLHIYLDYNCRCMCCAVTICVVQFLAFSFQSSLSLQLKVDFYRNWETNDNNFGSHFSITQTLAPCKISSLNYCSIYNLNFILKVLKCILDNILLCIITSWYHMWTYCVVSYLFTG